MDSKFFADRLAATALALTAAEIAETELLSGAIESYSMDTGQTKTVITKLNIGMLRIHIDSLMNRYATLDARVNGSGAAVGRPGW